MNYPYDLTQIQTIVIGGGQAGLSVGYHLAKRDLPFVILDANLRIGDAWRNRWDSLRLFSPARYSGLPGMRFPAPGSSFPNKEQMADYLVDYARRFGLHVRNGVTVDRLWREGGRFVISAGNQRFEAENVVVAMANYQIPHTPAFARELDPGIIQIHSHAYRNPSQLQEGGVLVVGVGNSGGDIAMEVARTHPTWLSGKESGHIPWRIETYLARHFLVRLVRFAGHHVLSVNTPIGRKLRPRLLRQATPLVRVKPQDLLEAGIERVARTVGVEAGLPLLADGRALRVRNVIWCTGYQHGFPWIDLPIYGDDGGHEPVHEQGVVPNVPGLYFVGLHFLYAMSSATLIGVGRDAERIVGILASRVRSDPREGERRTISVEAPELDEFPLGNAITRSWPNAVDVGSAIRNRSTPAESVHSRTLVDGRPSMCRCDSALPCAPNRRFRLRPGFVPRNSLLIRYSRFVGNSSTTAHKLKGSARCQCDH